MKKIFIHFFSLIIYCHSAFAQTLPDIAYQDYGYTKPIKKVTQLYYSIDYANDGSIKNVEEVEKVTQIFNADGNIESYENKSFLDESWAKSQSAYKQGRMHKQLWIY
ncbi:hypothetical protein, partial [Pedobacter sp.]